jgi:hypothetical protein
VTVSSPFHSSPLLGFRNDPVHRDQDASRKFLIKFDVPLMRNDKLRLRCSEFQVFKKKIITYLLPFKLLSGRSVDIEKADSAGMKKNKTGLVRNLDLVPISDKNPKFGIFAKKKKHNGPHLASAPKWVKSAFGNSVKSKSAFNQTVVIFLRWFNHVLNGCII